MINRGRYVQIPLAKASTQGPIDTLELSSIAPDTPQFLLLPPQYYPIPPEVNQIILYWHIQTMPTGGSYVDITPIAANSIISTVLATAGIGFGAVASQAGGAPTRVYYKFQFNDLDITNNRVNPKNFTIRKTAADGSLTVDAVSFRTGTRHALECFDPYLAFLLQADGTAATGSMQIYATFGTTS